MTWAPAFLVLICYCTGSGAQFALTQESSLTVSPGSTVKLSCSRSSGSIGGDNHPSWYQQRLGGVPLLLVYSTGASDVNVRPSGIDARFAGSVSGSTAYLTISGAEAGDDADYYCAMYAGSGTYTNTGLRNCKRVPRRDRSASSESELCWVLNHDLGPCLPRADLLLH
ncbi:hypothetical protein NDU88_006789, partial [Pleurodeles waltl]